MEVRAKVKETEARLLAGGTSVPRYLTANDNPREAADGESPSRAGVVITVRRAPREVLDVSAGRVRRGKCHHAGHSHAWLEESRNTCSKEDNMKTRVVKTSPIDQRSTSSMLSPDREAGGIAVWSAFAYDQMVGQPCNAVDTSA